MGPEAGLKRHKRRTFKPKLSPLSLYDVVLAERVIPDQKECGERFKEQIPVIQNVILHFKL
jgi:hypothetical protein